MLPLRIEGYTRKVGVNQPGVYPIYIRDEYRQTANNLQIPVMVTAFELDPGEIENVAHGSNISITFDNQEYVSWKLSAEQREHLASGGKLVYTVSGVAFPATRLFVSKPHVDDKVGVQVLRGHLCLIETAPAPALHD